ncbi:MAG: hypothetical protein HOH58_03955 [Opitutaceae bacterium]|nr:hypothetical protein [Opitutaceae bacterium]
MSSLRILLLFSLVCSAVWADDKPIPVSIYSRVSPNYERELEQDGTYKREFYAIGYGGRVDGTVWDTTQEKENFPEIAGIVAEELAKQNYHFSPDKNTADLLIVLHWGTTAPFNSGNLTDSVNLAGDAFRALNDAQSVQVEVDTSSQESTSQTVSLVSEQQMEIQRANAALDGALTSMQAERADQSRRDEQTAKVLGYTDELARNNDMARFAGSDRFNILINEVQEPRYYVVVTAYDFDEITNQKKKKRKPDPEWITRFSIRTRGNDFMDRIDDMAMRAGNYFGRESGRLIRQRTGEVEIGDMQVIETDTATFEEEN